MSEPNEVPCKDLNYIVFTPIESVDPRLTWVYPITGVGFMTTRIPFLNITGEVLKCGSILTEKELCSAAGIPYHKADEAIEPNLASL